MPSTLPACCVPPKDLRSTVGYSKVSVSKYTLMNQLETAESGEDVTYYIISAQDGVLLASREEAEDPFAQQAATLEYASLLETARSGATVAQDGVLLSAYEIERVPFLLVSVAEPLALSSSGRTLVTGLSAAAALVVVFSCVLVVVVSNVITVPLKRLGQDMEALSNEDFSVRGEVRGKDEIARLTHHFNTMADKLDYLYRVVYMGQLQLKQAQLKTLQSQISPHFLYNTLDTIYWMSKLGDNEKAAEMISNLSRLMRFTLTPGDNLMVQLADEMEYLQSYIGIQQIRYGDQVAFETDCPETLGDAYVLKLLLQPLVENALVHGLKHGDKGIIRICVYAEEDTLVYDVMNNGIPIEEAQINDLIEQPIEDYRGFALHNIAERIKLKNGEGYTLRCFVQGEYSVFRITQKLVWEAPQTTQPEEADDGKG